MPTDVAEFEQSGSIENQSKWWKKYTSWIKFVVYLPKFVTVKNPKLGLVNFVLTILCIAFTLYYFLTNKKYLIAKEPLIEISVCDSNCFPSAAVIDAWSDKSASYCTVPEGITDSKGVLWKNPSCVARCGSSFNGSSCIGDEEMVLTGPESFFVPTFYTEMTQVSTAGNCSHGMTKVGNACEKKGAYFVSGAEKNHVVFNHEFRVEPHKMSIHFTTPKTLQSHSGSFTSKGWENGMISLLFDSSGEKKKEFQQSEALNFTIEELISAAHYGDGPTDGQTPLTANTKYKLKVGAQEISNYVRTTGIKLTIDIFITDRGKCPIYDVFRHKIRNVHVENNRPMACLFVYAERAWTVRETYNLIGTTGIRSRSVSGVSIDFRKLGKFEFLDDREIIRNLNVFFVWIQGPLVLTYYFCIMCLGVLSKIYSRVIHEELHVPSACRGMIGRLMAHSSAYHDLQEGPLGMGKKRIEDRFRDYLVDNDEIDDDELRRFVDFVYDGLKSVGSSFGDKDHVSLQEFCEVASSNEPLKLKVLCSLFDADRKVYFLERFFLDKELREMAVKSEEAPDVPESAGEQHSRIREVYDAVQQLMYKVMDSEASALETARALEAKDETLALLGDENALGSAVGPAPAKEDQRESFISVEDEECVGKDDYD